MRRRIGGVVGFELTRVVRGALHVVHGNAWDAANAFHPEGILRQDQRGTFASFPWGSYLVVDFVDRVRDRVPEIERIKPLGAYLRWAMRHRCRDAATILVQLLAFVVRYRFHRRVDQRVTFGELRRILRATCYSCDLAAQAADYLRANSAGVAVAGHTHRAMTERSGGGWYVNSGSWNPVISLVDGHGFRSVLRRTFVRVREAHAPELLEWVPGVGAQPFEPDFGHIHTH